MRTQDENGQALRGSLDALKESVRSGKTIKVGIRAISTLMHPDSVPLTTAKLPTTTSSTTGTGDDARLQQQQQQQQQADDDDDTICYIPALQPLITAGHVAMNCDACLLGPPYADAKHYAEAMQVAFLKPSTRGLVEVYSTKPGAAFQPGMHSGGFKRSVQRAAMCWLVAA